MANQYAQASRPDVILSTPKNSIFRFLVQGTWTLTNIDAYSGTTASGSDAVFDVNLNNTSIWDSDQTQRIKIVDTATSGSKSSLSVSCVKGDVITVDYDSGPAIGGNLDFLFKFTE